MENFELIETRPFLCSLETDPQWQCLQVQHFGVLARMRSLTFPHNKTVQYRILLSEIQRQALYMGDY